MPNSSSTMGSRSTYQCGIHEVSDIDSDFLANAENRLSSPTHSNYLCLHFHFILGLIGSVSL